MRPGRFHPGNQQILCLGLDRIGAASMRPGRFHPGNNQVGTELYNQHRASMRPGRFHPGNFWCGWLWFFGWLSFNEAGAFPPRK